jgi:hypothetical protein
MGRCHLKGSEGDAIHAVLCAPEFDTSTPFSPVFEGALHMNQRLGCVFWIFV